MPQVADDFSDAGLKPFTIPGAAGEPGTEVSTKTFSLDSSKESTDEKEEAEASSDSEEEKPAPKKEEKQEPEAKKVQDYSEKLYDAYENRAMNEEGFLETLISGDTVQRRMAGKILERNAKHFGAKNFEDYKIKRTREQAGSDPTKQDLAEIRARQDLIDSKRKGDEWEKFKEKNAVSGEFEKVADSVHEEHPELSYGLIVAAARGLSLKETPSNKASSATVSGSVGAPASGEDSYQAQTQFGKAMVRGMDTKAVNKWAKKYYSS